MTSYTKVFGGTTIYPSDVSYQAYSISSVTPFVLVWPIEASSTQVAARIMDITTTVANCVITLPDATLSSVGETLLFNNIGGYAFTVKDSAGNTVMSVSSGTAWQIYLENNSTTQGTWRAFQYGASISQANAATLAGNGLVALGATLNTSMPVTTLSVNYSVGANDRAKVFVWNGSAGTFSLPVGGTLGNNWFVAFRNSGTGNVAITPSLPSTINSSSTVSLSPGDSCIVITDGTNFFTLGLGKSAIFAFDYTSIDVSGTGSYVLSGTELNRISYRFTGTLTGNRTIIVPSTIQQYWVDNRTTGAFSLTVQPVGGAGYTVPTNTRAILYCNGIDVLLADTAAISLPIGISNGGTGATSAGGALINLGGSSVGTAVFTASTSASARSSLGSTTVGDAVFTATSQAAAQVALDVPSNATALALAVALG